MLVYYYFINFNLLYLNKQLHLKYVFYLLIQMIIKELKKKNYFRYIQILKIQDHNVDKKLALIFILEYELYKIFHSTQEELLRKIKYQWLADEIIKKESNFFLATYIKKSFNNTIQNQVILIIKYLRDIENECQKFESIVLLFKKINIVFNNIFKIIGCTEFKISFFAQLLYFCYVGNSNSKNYFFEDFLPLYDSLNKKEFDNYEKTFVQILLKKIKKSKKILRITKLEFLLRLIYNRILM